MDETEALLRVDATRRAAMISGDVAELAGTLSDELIWTHSSGKTENKTAVLEAISSKSVSYESLEISDYSISQHGDIFVFQGSLNGHASRDGVAKEMKSKFLSVWGQKGSSVEMLAWQSTNF